MLFVISLFILGTAAFAQKYDCQCAIFGTGMILTSPALLPTRSILLGSCSRDQCDGFCSAASQDFDSPDLLKRFIVDRNCRRTGMGQAFCELLHIEEKDLNPWDLRGYSRIPSCKYGWSSTDYKFKTRLCCTKQGNWDRNNTRDCPGYA